MTEDESGPRNVYVEPTNACNLACSTCLRHAWDEPEGFMAWETFEAVIEGLDAGATVAFMGLGEPLLHPRLLDMVRLAKAHALRVEVTTNALLLENELALGLLEAALDQLVVSIDGASAEAFGRVRSGASLERVVEHVRYLNDRRGPYYGPRPRVGIEFVAMRSNIAELPMLGRLASRIGASFIIVSNVLPYSEELVEETLYDCVATSIEGGRGSPYVPRWSLPRMDLRSETLSPLMDVLRCSGSVDFLDISLRSRNNHCPFIAADAVAVGWDGRVSPCPPLLHS